MDNNIEHKNTEKYWGYVFALETNRDKELHKAFSELHNKIVEEVITFCKEHNLTDVDEFTISADGLSGSIPHEQWCPCTDSSMSMVVLKKDKDTGMMIPDRDKPFLFEL